MYSCCADARTETRRWPHSWLSPVGRLLFSGWPAGRWLLGLFIAVGGCLTPVFSQAQDSKSNRQVLTEPLPIQDNELVVGISSGIFFAREQASPTTRDVRLRIGGEHEIYVGFLNRALSWLDAELVAGLNLAWLGEEGFRQETAQGEQTSSTVVGFHVRGTVRLVPWPGAGPTLSTGLLVSVMTAPVEGWVTRFFVEAGLGWDIHRTAEHHFGVDLVYGWPAFDGLERVDGSPFLNELHRVLLRFAVGF